MMMMRNCLGVCVFMFAYVCVCVLEMRSSGETRAREREGFREMAEEKTQYDDNLKCE